MVRCMHSGDPKQSDDPNLQFTNQSLKKSIRLVIAWYDLKIRENKEEM